MAIFPFDILDPATRRIPLTRGVVAPIANSVLDSFCQDSDNVEQWEAATRDGLDGAIARRVQPITRQLRQQFCPLNPPPSTPLSIAPSRYGTGGDSFGRIRGYAWFERPEEPGVINRVGFDSLPWECPDNRGLPVGDVFLRQLSATSGVYTQIFRRADGTERFQSVSGQIPTTFEKKGFVIEEYNVQSCDDAIIQIFPPGVQLPPIPPGTPPPPIPQFPITINLPQPPGFPDLNFPVVYIPITPTLDLSPRLTFRPQVQLPGFPQLPDVTLDLGGISIGDGGDLTIGDIESIINDAGGGGVCPDPCEPVDYAAIAQIVFEELDLKFPPGRPVGGGFTDYEAADSRQVVLPDFATSIDIQITELSPEITKYSGGTNAPMVALCGWYSFGDNTTVGARLPLSYEQSSILVPKGARGFSYTLKGGSLAILRVNFLTATLPPDPVEIEEAA